MRDAETPATTPTPGHTSATRPKEETARRGTQLYQRDIRPHLKNAHHGEYIANDVDSGNRPSLTIFRVQRLLPQRSGAIDVWQLRVGHRALKYV